MICETTVELFTQHTRPQSSTFRQTDRQTTF